MMAAKKSLLTVVIPAYNESDNLETGVLDEVYAFLKNQKYTWDVIIVDDGSTDDTLEKVRKFAKNHQGFSVLAEPHRGKAGTVIAGMLGATGEIVLFSDMDQATPLKEINKFLPKFDTYDIVIGSRSGREGAPLTRKIMAYGFMMLRTIILRLPYQDTQCGFKAFRREAAQEIFKRMKVFTQRASIKGAAVNAGFDLEILYISRKLGYKVAEIPVEWHHKGTARVNPIKDSIEGLKGLMLVRLNAIRGLYKV